MTSPEGIHYTIIEDTGCDAGGPSCLECKLPRCVHDVAGYEYNSESKQELWTKVFEARKNGVPPAEISRAYGISPRQIHRIVQHGGVYRGQMPSVYFKGGEPKKSVDQLHDHFIKPRKPWPKL